MELELGRAYISLTSGCEVSIEQLHIELSTLGVLEGDFETIRDHVLERVPERAKKLFGSDIGLCVFPPMPGELPTYLLFVSLISFKPVREGAFSHLVSCWFVETLPVDLVNHLTESVRTLHWDRLAVDGDF